MAVTMKDIARLAGVAQSAVSAVLNGTTASRVSPKKRELILKISQDLHYRRNFAAAALKQRKTGLLGFIGGGLLSPYFSELTMAITEMAARRGYRLILTLMSCDKGMDINYLNRMISNMCDGILMCREVKNEGRMIQDSVLKSRIPFVMLSSRLDKLPSVCFDYLDGMKKAFAELMSKGHRKIAFGGHLSDAKKISAYQQCCAENGIEPIEYYILPEHDLKSAFACGAKIVASRQRQTALICTDYSLNMMYPGMAAGGLRIPKDVSVIAFNDTRQSRCFVPALTSISLDSDMMARCGVDVLLEQINQDGQSDKIKNVLIPPELILRDSVACIQP